MRDIATRCGVSISAVSLVLNDQHDGRLSVDTAERIRQATEELGYLPNLAARGLRTRQTRTLGLLSDGVASVPFSGQMLAGAQSTAWREGYVLLLVDMAGNPDMEGPAVRSLLQRSVEGLIVAVDRSTRARSGPPGLAARSGRLGLAAGPVGPALSAGPEFLMRGRTIRRTDDRRARRPSVCRTADSPGGRAR
ncbi:LacI family DNA-binding transcriptional regulator [Streptomyces scopuliridis]|uniref:LacI family DNA-binding transcriptional regulator n=1 Tax=Streptomyces scopuliridis TaxID=452529 RepID=UPI0036B5D255